MVGPVLEISFVESGAGHVPKLPTSETQYIALTKSGHLRNNPRPSGFILLQNSDNTGRHYPFAICVAGAQRNAQVHH